MPLIENPTYETTRFFKNPHVNAIVSNKFRRVPKIKFERERIEMPDGDFFDADWLPKKSSNKLAILLPGLEGDTNKTYMRGMKRIFAENGFDAVGLNHRGCSGEDNRLLQTYHMANTYDVRYFISKIEKEYNYDEIILIGFSLGGNIALKFGIEEGASINSKIKKIIAISVPTELLTSAKKFENWENQIYRTNFFLTLKKKARQKNKKFPGILDEKQILSAKQFKEFDEHFTSRINGFENYVDYYTRAATVNDVDKIVVPTLLITAKDDTFVSQESFPYEMARNSDTFFLIAPQYGGHCGFMPNDENGYLWSEKEAIQFAQKKITPKFISNPV